MNEIIAAAQMKDWYVFAGLVLTLIIQIVRKTPKLKNVWEKVPEGARFLIPLITGAAGGFTEAFASGATWQDALLQALMGALGIGMTSMGFAAALTDSPVPWDGGAGGRPRVKQGPRGPLPPPISRGGAGMATLALVLLLSGCGVSWPKVVEHCAPAPEELIDDVSNVLRNDPGPLSDRALDALEELAKKHGPSIIICVVNDIIDALTSKVAASPAEITIVSHGREFLKRTGTKVEP